MDMSAFGQGFEGYNNDESSDSDVALESEEMVETISVVDKYIKKKKKSKKSKTPYIKVEDLELKFPNRIMLLGPSESGKTNLLRCIVKQSAEQFDFIFLFSPSEHEEGWLPRSCRHNKICMKRIKQIWEWSMANQGKYNVLIVLDDAAGSKELRNTFFQDFITRCRHDNISLIVSIQYLKIFPPCFRDNIKQYYICKANNAACKNLCDLLSIEDYYGLKAHMKEVKQGKVALLDFTLGAQELSYVKVPLCENYKIKL